MYSDKSSLYLSEPFSCFFILFANLLKLFINSPPEETPVKLPSDFLPNISTACCKFFNSFLAAAISASDEFL
jgi:hypothetical protein